MTAPIRRNIVEHGIFLIAIIAASCASFTAGAQSPSTQPTGKFFARQLANECDDLINSAIKRPYGWAWMEQGGDDSANRKAVRVVSFAPRGSASAGLILWYAADLLGQPRFADAARQVARGVSAAQTAHGKFPVEASFGPSVVVREPPAPLPDRGSTCASLALLLTIVDAQEKRDDPIYRAANRAATWLLKQQADTGAWPVLDPPDAPAVKQSRIARLDTTDFRNSTMTILLAYEVLGDPLQRRSAEKSIEFLARTRNADRQPIGASMWTTAYSLTGVAINDKRFPLALDVQSTRHAIQSSLALYLILGDGQNVIRSKAAAKSIGELPHENGHWAPKYTPQGELFPDSSTPRPNPGVFGEASKEQGPTLDDAAITGTLRLVETIAGQRREKTLDQLKPWFTPRQVLAHTAAGFSDGEIPLDLATAADQVPEYLNQHAELFKLLDGPPPAELKTRVVRLWALYLRALIEIRTGA